MACATGKIQAIYLCSTACVYAALCALCTLHSKVCSTLLRGCFSTTATAGRSIKTTLAFLFVSAVCPLYNPRVNSPQLSLGQFLATLGHFHGPDVPCFPAAPVGPGEGKRPMVIFSHGLGGNRAVYAEHGAAYAAQVST